MQPISLRLFLLPSCFQSMDFWRLHVMDYSEGEDFNNKLLRGASVAAIALVITGLVLMVLALRRSWRHRR